MKNSSIGQAWLVIVLSLCFGGALAGVQTALEERIAGNRLAETLGQIPHLVPGAAAGTQKTVAGRTVYSAEAEKGDPVGWVIPCGGRGFADRIELLLGVDATAKVITGLYVLDQKETPGLGNKIVESVWRNQFVGKSTGEPLVVSRAGRTGSNQVDAVTGATISSESVCAIINETMKTMGKELVAAK